MRLHDVFVFFADTTSLHAKREEEREREKRRVHTRRCVAVTYLGSGIMDESETFEEKELSRNGWACFVSLIPRDG